MLAWPARSPDLKPFHVYLPGNLKSNVSSPTVQLLVQWNSNKMKRVDSHRGMGLVGYYEAYSSNSLPTFRDNLSVPSSRLKKSNS